MYGWSAVKHSSIYILIKDEEKKNATTEFKLSPKAPKVHWINSSFFKLILMTQFFDVLILWCAKNDNL